MNTPKPDYLSTRQVADLTGLSVEFFEKQRHTGIDPIPFAKIGRRVVYRRADVDAYIAARLCLNTSEARASATDMRG